MSKRSQNYAERRVEGRFLHVVACVGSVGPLKQRNKKENARISSYETRCGTTPCDFVVSTND